MLQLFELARDRFDVGTDQAAVLFALGDELLAEIEDLIELRANTA